ncbi:MAG: SBBP repeat-containing protein [Bacteroidota bacterium]
MQTLSLKKILALCPVIVGCYFLLFSTLSASAQRFQWANQNRGNWSANKNITTDAQGNVYSIAIITDSVDADPSPIGLCKFVTRGSLDFFFRKLDKDGNFLWAKQIGGEGIESGNTIALDATGNVYIAGTFSGPTDFDPSATSAFMLTSAPGVSTFVAKYSNTGDFLWAEMQGAGAEQNTALAVDGAGNVYVSGFSQSAQVDYDPSPTATSILTNQGGQDVFLSSFDKDGKFRWAKGLGGPGTENSNNLTVSDNGLIFLLWSFKSDSIDADPDPVKTAFLKSGGKANVLFSIFNAQGVFQKGAGFSAKTDAFGSSLVINHQNDVLMTGSFSGDSVDFDPYESGTNLYSTGTDPSLFMLKMSQNGVLKWVKAFEQTFSYANSIAVDRNDNIYVGGAFQGQMDFDPSANPAVRTSKGLSDFFVAKYSTVGDFISVDVGGDGAYDQVNSVCTDVNDNVLASGAFTGTVDFDPGISAYSMNSVYGMGFLMKLSGENVSGIAGVAGRSANLKAYPNPFRDLLIVEATKSGDYELVDALGKVVRTGTLTAGRNPIAVAELSEGVYVFRTIFDGNEPETLLLVK